MLNFCNGGFRYRFCHANVIPWLPTHGYRGLIYLVNGSSDDDVLRTFAMIESVPSWSLQITDGEVVEERSLMTVVALVAVSCLLALEYFVMW